MSTENSNFDMPDEPSGDHSTWFGLIAVVVVLALGSLWVWHERTQQKIQDATVGALEKEVNDEHNALEAERNRVFELSSQLDGMKQAIDSGKFKGAERQKAVDDYNKVAADQRAERERAKALADQYNEKVNQLHQLQQ
jgi:uncharacterized protein HemX